MCGCGVGNLLAKELGEVLDVPEEKVRDGLDKVIAKYYEMDDEEAYKKTFPNGYQKDVLL